MEEQELRDLGNQSGPLQQQEHHPTDPMSHGQLAHPKKGLRAVAALITSFGSGLPNIYILPAVWMLFLFGMAPRKQTDASNCVHVSFVLSLMDYSPGEILVCGRMSHDLLLGWHFGFIISYPIGKISQVIQVSTAPNAKRVEADKTTCNMVWRAEEFAVKWK